MFKVLLVTVLACSAYASNLRSGSELMVLDTSPLGSLIYGFMYGLQLDPSSASTNPCLLQIQSTVTLKSNLNQAAINIYKGAAAFYSFIDALRQYADAYNQEMNLCKVPNMITLLTSALDLSNIGEYAIKYIVKANVYNDYLNTAKQAYLLGDYQTAGENMGKIFMGLTNFYI